MKYNNTIKLFIMFLISLVILIGGIMTSLSILKHDAVENHLSIAKLAANFFAKELNQDIYNVEVIMNNIDYVIDFSRSKENINSNLKKVIIKYPQIRSLNILKEEKILYSSNINNLDINIGFLDFYPRPLLENNILRVSKRLIGRDFEDTKENTLDVNSYINNISFIPITKNIVINDIKYKVVLNLSSDYFINRFSNNFSFENMTIDLLRIDGYILESSKKEKYSEKSKISNNFLEEALIKNSSSGIEKIDKTNKNIISYVLTKDYPFVIAVYSDFNKSLSSWEEKRYDFFLVSIILVLFFILLAFISFYMYKKEQEKELKLHQLQIEDNKKFKILFDNNYFLSAIVDKDAYVIDINNTALKFLKVGLENIKGKLFWELDCWPIEEKEKLKKILLTYKDDEFPEFQIEAVSNKGQMTIDVIISSIIINKKKQLIIMGRDVTRKIIREKKLKQAYTVFNNTRDGIVITDISTNILDVNKSFENITGYNKREILNKKIQLLKSNTYSDEFYKDMWENLNEHGYWEGEIQNRKKDKSLYTEWLTINTIYDDNKNILNYIGIFSDITEQQNKSKLLKEKEALLFQQSKMASMGEMIENIAHQWRQPLSVITTSSTGILLEKELGILKDKDEEEFLKAINDSAQYLSKTIDDFRNFLQNDKVQNEFSIKEVIEKSIKLISSKLKNREIQIINEIDDSEIIGIKNEFIQVVINILNNAKDALESKDLENKYIFIKTAIKGNHIIIKIRDNAGGIPEDIIYKIFEPYFTTKHQSKGTGIGLYMSEKIIKSHMHGELEVKNINYTYNNKEEIGAEFRICLPIL